MPCDIFVCRCCFLATVSFTVYVGISDNYGPEPAYSLFSSYVTSPRTHFGGYTQINTKRSGRSLASLSTFRALGAAGIAAYVCSFRVDFEAVEKLHVLLTVHPRHTHREHSHVENWQFDCSVSAYIGYRSPSLLRLQDVPCVCINGAGTRMIIERKDSLLCSFSRRISHCLVKGNLLNYRSLSP